MDLRTESHLHASLALHTVRARNTDDLARRCLTGLPMLSGTITWIETVTYQYNAPLHRRGHSHSHAKKATPLMPLPYLMPANM